MRLTWTVLMCIVLAAGCGKPGDTVIPRDIEKIGSIMPVLQKLPAEERELVTSYIIRHDTTAKPGGLTGGKAGPGMPEGMTIAKAIEEQRKYIAERGLEEARQNALKAKPVE